MQTPQILSNNWMYIAVPNLANTVDSIYGSYKEAEQIATSNYFYTVNSVYYQTITLTGIDNNGNILSCNSSTKVSISINGMNFVNIIVGQNNIQLVNLYLPNNLNNIIISVYNSALSINSFLEFKYIDNIIENYSLPYGSWHDTNSVSVYAVNGYRNLSIYGCQFNNKAFNSINIWNDAFQFQLTGFYYDQSDTSSIINYGLTLLSWSGSSNLNQKCINRTITFSELINTLLSVDTNNNIINGVTSIVTPYVPHIRIAGKSYGF